MFELGPVEPYKLSRPPLAQALAQVRFPLFAKLQTYEGIAPFQDIISEQYPYMDKITETALSMTLGQASSTPSESTVSWQFKDDDGRLLVVSSNAMTLSVGKQYVGFEDFSARFAAALAALAKSLSPRRCLQVGVRYLNVIDVIGEGEDLWKELFKESIVGWPATQIVGNGTRLQSSVSQIQLVASPIDDLANCPAEIQAIIRHGVAPAASLVPGVPVIRLEDRAFFLDTDVLVVASQNFNKAEILQQITVMHSQIDRFFRWTLTNKGEEYFGLEEVPDASGS